MGGGVVGSERQRLVLGGQRIGEPAERLQRHAAVAMGLGKAAHHADRRIELAQRVARPPLSETDIAHDVAADRILQCRAAGRLQQRRGLIEPSGLDMRNRRAERVGKRALGRLFFGIRIHAAGKLAEPNRMEQLQSSTTSLGSSLRSLAFDGK